MPEQTKQKALPASNIAPFGKAGLQVTGAMTFATARQLLAQSKPLLRDVKALTLDLSKVQQTDSAGLALLLEWLAQANRQGCRVSIQGLPASLLSVARMCHLDGLLASQTVKSGE